jgi:PKD repeat protein
MKKAFLSLILLFTIISGFSQQWTSINGSAPQAGSVKLVSSDIERSTLRVALTGFFLNGVSTPLGNAMTVSLDQTTPILEQGAPDLPKFTASLVIPDQAGMSVRVIASTYRDYPNVVIAPSKGVLTRDIDPATVPFTYGAAYSTNQFYPGTLAGTREPFIIRDVRGLTVVVYPFQYNPVTRVLRVYDELTVELYKASPTGENPLFTGTSVKQIDPSFRQLITSQFLNTDAMTYEPLEEYGNLLVVCYGPFMDAMMPYVNWKQAMGYPTEIINKDSVGNTAAQIKSFIANYYTTKGLAHVLIVGDAAQVPTNTGGGLGGPSDNAYGYVVGSDHYSDVFVGRFSAENVEQVQTQVQRTLDYEQNPQNLSNDWFTTAIGIASDQGPGDDNEYDYQHIRGLQTECLGYTYTANPELFDGSQGGNDAPGNPTPAMVGAAVDSGASIILYTGHGSNTSWGTSGFSNYNVNQLHNQGMLPFVWSVACVNGNFTSGTCFAEAWLRATQGGQPTGAVAFLGSTINQSWNSPMEGQDEMVRLLTEGDSLNIKRTFAGLSINGCFKMIQSYGSDGAQMADTWTVFGDPTIMVRTAVPEPLVAEYDTLIYVTDSTLAVYCNVPDARATLTSAGSILATGLVVNDTALLQFPPALVQGDTLHLVITAYNRIPLQDILVVRDVPLAIVAAFTAAPTTVIPGQTVAFADTSFGMPTHWEWHFPGGTPEISSARNPVVMYSTVGTYDVELVVGDGFTADTLVKPGYIVADFPAGAGETNDPYRAGVLPNPSNGIFTLKLQTAHADQLDITVFDLLGNKVYQESVTVSGNQDIPVMLASQPEGVYFLKIAGGNATTTKRIIIKR